MVLARYLIAIVGFLIILSVRLPYRWVLGPLGSGFERAFWQLRVSIKREAPLQKRLSALPQIKYWVAVKELQLSYHNSDTIFIPISPYYGNLNYKVLNSNPE